MQLGPFRFLAPSFLWLLAGLGPLAVQEKFRASEIILGEGLLREVHVRGVGFLASGQLAGAGGQLAFQMPASHDDVSHVLADELIASEPYRSAAGGWRRPQHVLAPVDYARLLHRLGFADPEVRLEAVRALGALRCHEAVAVLRDVATGTGPRGTDLTLRREGIQALATIGTPEAWEALAGLGRRRVWPWRRAERQPDATAAPPKAQRPARRIRSLKCVCPGADAPRL